MTEDMITVISGVPRSGTSMMMQMLAAGGMPILSDGVRTPDASNPRGYFELEKVKRLATDRSWLAEAQGKAIKVIAHLMPHLAPEFQYKVILMDRELEEVLASQQSMLERLGRPDSTATHRALAAAFERQLADVPKVVARLAVAEMLTVGYRDAIDRPAEVAGKVAEFLGEHRLDTLAMAEAVERSLYRERRACSATDFVR